MYKVGLSEAKRKFSELVRRAERGERIGITKRGKLVAVFGPVEGHDMDINEIFDIIDRIRKRVKPLKGVTIKELIEEGRR